MTIIMLMSFFLPFMPWKVHSSLMKSWLLPPNPIAPISCDIQIVNVFQYSTRTLSTQSVLPTEPI